MKIKFLSALALSCMMAFTGLDASALTLRDCALYSRPKNLPEMVSENSGETYLMMSEDGSKVERFDYKTGKKLKTVMDCDQLRDCDVQSWAGYIMSPNEKLMLLYTNVQPIYRHSFKAEYYVYDIARNNIKPLSTNGLQEVPTFSPDGRMIAFVRDNNIYIAKLDYGTEVAVTKDGAVNKVINGVPDWVYQEEFGMLSSLAWAPDNSILAFIRWDESEVPTFSFPVYGGACPEYPIYRYYPGKFEYKYPVAGQVNSKVQVISYDVETRASKTMKVPLDVDGYVNKIEFGLRSDRLMVNTMNRNQNLMKLYAVNPRSASAKLIYTDKSDSWIDPFMTEMTRYYENSFVVASEKSGYCHLYEYSNAGSLIKQLTTGDWNVTDYYGYNVKNRRHYFQATYTSPLDRVVAYVNPNNEVKVVSSAKGTSSAKFSKTLAYYVMEFSDVKTPKNFTMYNIAGKKLRTLEDNAEYAARYQDIPAKEFFTFTANGNEFNGYMIKPLDFNPNKKYPVIMYQYSGPSSQLVLNKWDLDWLHYAAQSGYIIACVDGRGTGGRSKDFAAKVYMNLGKYESIDQVAAANYMGSLSFVDKNKIGIFGWSYGGYETLMAMSQEGSSYAAGVAVAPVTDWGFYDTIYAERYMRTPQQNAEGYINSSAINRVGKLNGRLLIITGTADDNVHASNTFEYVAKAVSMNKIFDMMVYPNKNHHINGCETRFALYSKILDFFDQHLK